jgi:glucose-6-phosphate isomerase
MRSAYDPLTRWPALDVAARRHNLQGGFQLFPGPLQPAIAAHADAGARAAAGLWRRDPAVWSRDDAVQRTIANRLGWLTSPSLMADALPRLESFAAAVRGEGFTDVVLLGMGGSSLAPEVLRAVLGVAPGWPRFHMLDSTDPAAVRAVGISPATTLFVLASKSGTTIEPNSLAAHFRQELERLVPQWNRHFVAITDDATELAERAAHDRYREVFINPSDIGGRYSALSYFGLVPAALMGQDLSALTGWGLAMLSLSETDTADVMANPAIALGVVMGAAALNGRDKLTLLLPPALEPFGLWVEQLVAESTGKQGKGVVPIAGEEPGQPADYGPDRCFVRLRDAGGDTRSSSLADFANLAAPVADIALSERSALGAEFVRWEIATAVAGALLGVNPFDEPNVKQAKDATGRLLSDYSSTGEIPLPTADRKTTSGMTLTLTSSARTLLNGRGPEAFLSLLREGDYFGLLAFLGPDAELAAALGTFRKLVRARTKAATMFGYGPRYLHSTGQLHKGGLNSGVFLLITSTPREDLPIPGQPFSFGTLELAQALGDFSSLETTGRRALHVHLPAPAVRYLQELDMLIEGLTAA